MQEDGRVTYDDTQFEPDQLQEIKLGLDAGLDVTTYAKKEFLAIQMHQIRLGLEEGLDVSLYASPDYDWFQMEEIRQGLFDNVDYRKYASPSIEYRKMRQIRKALLEGIDLSRFSAFDAGILRQMRKALQDKINITSYIKEGYTADQLEQIRLALKDGLDIVPYLSKNYRDSALREIRIGLEEGLKPFSYAKPEYGWQQMREIRLGLIHRVDIAQYSNPLYSWQQMREIRLGLEEGLDVSEYRSLMYTATDMERMRKKLAAPILEHILSDEPNIIHIRQFSVHLSVDELQAYVQIEGSIEDELTEEELHTILRNRGIVMGLLEDEIHRIIKNRCYNQSILVAEGKKPVNGKDGWYEYFFETTLNKSPRILEDGSVDYGSVQWYEAVEEGQKIAYYHAAKEGTPGFTVTGNTLKAKKGKEQNILSGKGFVLLQDKKTYISAMDGKIDLYDNGRLEITRLCILDDVSPTTGNVNFDGCIHIRGCVRSGSLVTATEDIIINGSVESAIIKAGGEILLRQGANGSGQGLIQADTQVSGSFFESIRVKSKGNIVANYCMHCDLSAEDSILIRGTKGLILGGTAQAANRIEAHHIGNQAGVQTSLRLGLTQTTLDKKKKLELELTEAERQFAILKHEHMDFQRKYPPELRNTMDIYLKLESAIYTKELHLRELHKSKASLDEIMERMTGACAVISGALHEGTMIFIDNRKWISPGVRDVTVRRVNEKIVAYSN